MTAPTKRGWGGCHVAWLPSWVINGNIASAWLSCDAHPWKPVTMLWGGSGYIERLLVGVEVPAIATISQQTCEWVSEWVFRGSIIRHCPHPLKVHGLKEVSVFSWWHSLCFVAAGGESWGEGVVSRAEWVAAGSSLQAGRGFCSHVPSRRWWSLFRALCCKRFSGYFPYNILEWVYFIVLFKRHDRKWWETPVITVKCHGSL